MSLVKVALIGYGYWGKKLEKYLTRDNGFNLVSICNSKTKLEKIFPKIEAVVIATPIETHYSLAKRALQAGKHVLSEKPLALTTSECLELKQLSIQKRKTIMVEYTQSFSPGLLKAVEIDIGILESIDMRVRHLGRFMEHDVYWLLASHCLSILDIFVPIKELTFMKVDQIKTDDRTETGIILFEKEKFKGQISLSLNYPGKDYQVVIYGSRGTIIYDTQENPSLKITWYNKKHKLLPPELITDVKQYDLDESNNLDYALKFFYKSITKAQEANINRAIEVTRVLENLKNIEKKNETAL